MPGLFVSRRRLSRTQRLRRLLLLPEVVFLAGVIVFGAYVADRYDYTAGQQAVAATNSVIQDGVPSPTTRQKQRSLQQRLQKDHKSILVFTGADVVHAFSYSDLKRQDGDMTMLQFRGTECILDVYLDARKKPVSYEFRMRQKAQEEPGAVNAEAHPDRCVDDILKSRHI